ncbi:MAG TPA: hypothetical protein VGC37_02445 [Friedmanniella sp.]
MLVFVAIAAGGLVVLALVALRLWRSARGLMEEVGVMADRAGELVDLLAQVELGGTVDPDARTLTHPGSELTSDDGWPHTVETYDDQGATAPGKKET